MLFVDEVELQRKSTYQIWLDQTTVSLWTNMISKTWVDRLHSVTLTKPQTRGRGLTIYGAIGGYRSERHNDDKFRSWFGIYDRTCSTNTIDFLKLVTSQLPVDKEQIIIYCDNHSSHCSRLT